MHKLKSIYTGWKNSILEWLGLIHPGKAALFEARLKECHSNECGNLFCGVCTACGCPVSKKTKSPTESCPENMWKPVYYTGVKDNVVIDYFEIPRPTRILFIKYLREKNLDPSPMFYDLEIWEDFQQWLVNVK